MESEKPSGELEKLKRIFDILDQDDDGTIALRDFRVAMDEQNESAQALTDEQRRALLRKADTNQDGSLNFKEFALLTTSREAEGDIFRRFLYSLADVTVPYDQRPHVHSYLSHYSCCPPPLFMLLVSVVQIGTFLYYTMSEGMKPGWFRGCAGCIVQGQLGPLPFSCFHRKEVWRFLSYMFVHAGLEHLLGNVLVQLILGLPLELVHKVWRVGSLYMMGVLLGSMLQYSLDPNVVLVGASGGVYALLFAHLANVIMNWSEMPFRWFRLAALTAFVGLDVGHVVYRRLALDQCDAVSYTAHIGGALAGLLLGMLILRNIHRLKWENVLRWLGFGLFAAIFIGLLLMTVLVQPETAPIFTTRCLSRP